MSALCELCGSKAAPLPMYPRFEIVRCPVCDLIFYAGDANATYDAEYFHGAEYDDYVADKSIAQANFARRLPELLKLAPGGRLLELGCAYGFFLDLAKEHYDVVGIDITEEGVAYARDVIGVDARCADFLELPDDTEKFDVICMWDTIEHLPHPAQFVAKAARWLKPGGVLVITTGDVASLVSRVRKDRWRMVHPPTHLYYFSPKTLGATVAQAGLQVHSVRHVGYRRSLRQVMHGVLSMGGKRTAWLYDDLLSKVTPDLPIYANLFDIMMLTATKPRV